MEGATPFEVVRAGYDRLGERYHAWSRAGTVRVRQVETLLARLRPGSTVVDLGCGPGDPATRMLADRHRVLGVDASAGQLRLARSAAPRATLVQADITRFALRAGSVDAVASFYALGHVPATAHAGLFAAVAGWLRPGGLLLASAPTEAGDGVDPSWLGVPMFFGGVGEPATREAVEAAGLAVESIERIEEEEDGRGSVEFLWVTAVKGARDST